MKKVPVRFVVNGVEKAEFVDSCSTLLSVLRDKIGDTSPKDGCHQGTCGACTVIVNGETRLSCLMLAETCEGATIETVKGLSSSDALHGLQQAFVSGFAAQCGFCTPGMIMAAKALLDRNPNPTREEVMEAISGNICRCTGYAPIVAAILSAAAASRRQ